MTDCLIVGGGIIGLSLAYELSRRDLSVELVDRQAPGNEASWAGAGILPPAPQRNATDPIDQLRCLSDELHPSWADALRDETGIDTGYRICGGIYLACTPGEAAALHGLAGMSADLGIAMQRLADSELCQREAALRPLVQSGQVKAAYLLPGEAQLRNPDHLRALATACQARGVKIHRNAEVTHFTTRDGQIQAAITTAGSFQAKQFCVTAGPWTYRLLDSLGIETGILPIRGQMVLFDCGRPTFTHIINEGQRYLVPRDDGKVLVGSTEEEVGFDKRTTPEVVTELCELAYRLIPSLKRAGILKTWAGLRPASFDGVPYLGRLPEFPNGFLAAGHFRSGIHLSTGTAVVMAELICGRKPPIDLAPFCLQRGSAASGRRSARRSCDHAV